MCVLSITTTVQSVAAGESYFPAEYFGGRRDSYREMAALDHALLAPDPAGMASPTEDQSILMLGGLLLSIIWTMRLIYYHVEPHIWHDVQVRT